MRANGAFDPAAEGFLNKWVVPSKLCYMLISGGVHFSIKACKLLSTPRGLMGGANSLAQH